jgi:FAD binding domain
MPLPDERIRLFFRDDDAGERPEVADAKAVIERHVPGPPRIRGAENRACFSLHHRVARRFRSGRVLLAGDAAHAMTSVNGSRTSLRGLLRPTELQLWICAGSGVPDDTLALAERFAQAVRATVLVIADRPPAAPAQVEVVADPELRAHGRLGAVADTAYVVRPDGHLGFRCGPPDAAPLREHLALLGVSV